MKISVVPARAAIAGTVVIVTALTGCGVKQDVLDDELARMRSEMQSGDQALDDRMTRMDRDVQAATALSERVQALERGLESMRAEFGGQIERMQAAIRFNSPVHFAYDSDQIRTSDRAVLDRFASVVKEYYPTATITVEGFADPAGNATYNLNLGLRRADAVKAYLTRSGGLEVRRIRTVSYGEASNRQVSPGAWGDTGLANRRVALVIDYSGGAPATAQRTEG